MPKNRGVAQSGPASRVTVSKPRILLAEDDDDLRELLSHALKQDGYRVTSVPDGEALVDEFKSLGANGKAMPTLAISDERMPGLSGLDAFRALRKAGVTIPLILVTAFGNDDLVDEAFKSGATVMRKPFDIGDFRTLVHYLVGDRHSIEPVACTACGAVAEVSWLDEDSGVVFCSDCRALSEQVEVIALR